MPRRLQRALERLDEVVAGGADVVGAVAEAEGGLGGDEDVFAAEVLDGFAEDGFAVAVGVDVGGVEEVEAGFHADVDDFAGFFDVGAPQALKNSLVTAEGAGAEAELGDFEAGTAKVSIFHGNRMPRDGSGCGTLPQGDRLRSDAVKRLLLCRFVDLGLVDGFDAGEGVDFGDGLVGAEAKDAREAESESAGCGGGCA